MSISDIDKKELVLAIVKHLTVPNIEQIARSAGLARVTVRKYLDEMINAGTLREVRCGNSRVFLIEPTGEKNFPSDQKNPTPTHCPREDSPSEKFEIARGDA